MTGFIVQDVDEAARAVQRIPELSRRRCRQVFEERFTAARMARDYVEVYGRLNNGQLRSAQATVRFSVLSRR